MRVRRRSTEAEAWAVAELCRAAKSDWKALPEPIRAGYEDGRVMFFPDAVDVRTISGEWIKCYQTDMVMCGTRGEFYPCEAQVFAELYEVIE